jgi:hypothetical protein
VPALNPVARRSSRGTTLIELLAALLILSVIVGMIGMTVVSGSRSYELGITSADVDGQARRLIDRLGREFLDASRSSLALTPHAAFGGVPDDGAIQADYRRVTGYAGGALQVGSLRSLRLVYGMGEIDDGLDNNGNGLIDECRIVILPDATGAPAQVVGLGGFVREYLEGESQDDADENGNGLSDERGLCFTYDPAAQVLTIRITIERMTSRGQRLTSTAQTSVRLRND